MKHRANASFTLVELLVVVAIITLLAALLLPALGKAKEQGRRAVCQSNLHQFALSLYAYVGDFNSRYPVLSGRPRPNELAWAGGGIIDVRPALQPYIVNPRVLYCPSNFSMFSADRQQDPAWGGAGWFEGWNSTNGVALIGYAFWPGWVYYSGIPANTIWTDPTEAQASVVETGALKPLAGDLTMTYTVLPIAGYNWYNHRRGGGSNPTDLPGTPEWAAMIYTDGSIARSAAAKWTVHVQTDNGLQFSW